MKALSHEQIATVYTSLMRDTKWRLENLNGWLKDLAGEMPDDTRHTFSELCFLNFRRICENVALATLAAHNKLPEATQKSFMDDYHPGSLFRKLARLNGDNFPVKMRETEVAAGQPRNFEMIKGEYLTSDQLSQIFGTCGNMLHVGNLKSLLKGKTWTFDLAEMTHWHRELVDHLSVHAVILPRFSFILLCQLSTREQDDVNVVISGTDDGVCGVHRHWGAPKQRRR